jgi:serine protease inhibitor
MHRENLDFDQSQYQNNINKRFMERDNYFFQDSNYVNEKRSDYHSFSTSKHIGEITGVNMNLSELEKGMPMRPSTFDDYRVPNTTETTTNPYLDFNLYDEKPNLNVQYYDNPQENFSNLDQQNYIIGRQINPKNNEINMSNTINIFTLDFFERFTEHLKSKKSFILSPFSIFQSFAILYMGSKNHTEETLSQYFLFPDKHTTFKSLLKINQEVQNSISQINLFCVPNNIIVNNAFLSYIDKLGLFIKYNPKNISQETQKINDLINQTTKGTIRNIIQPNILSSKLFTIINTIYFYSKWKIPFSTQHTKIEPFYGINKVETHMMNLMNSKHRYFEDHENQILEMDFEDDNICMGFILPKNSYSEPNIVFEKLQYYISKLQNLEIKQIKIPKFKHESRYKVDNLFKKYGLTEIFTNADLSEITPPINGTPTYISDIIHAAIIIVSEQGVKASASTVMYMQNSSSRQEIKFIANHQFLYYLRYKPLNTLLFIGKYY